MFTRNNYRILLCFVAVSCLTHQASAELLTFASLPLETRAPLPHTNFHTSDDGNGTGGSIVGWANLSPDALSTYDPVTGELDLNLRIFAGAQEALANTSPIGIAHGVSSDLHGSNFGQFDGEIIGSISWTFDQSVAARFFENPNRTSLTQKFVDFNYVTTADNYTANTWDGTNLTLWGADGTYLGPEFEGGGKFDTSTTSLGFDFVGVTQSTTTTTVVPEPSGSMLLFMGTACLGGFGYRERRRRGMRPSQQK